MKTFVGLILGGLFLLQQIHSASLKPFWDDEFFGIHVSKNQSFGSLFVEGPDGQASKSPLDYILQRAWLSTADFSPQQSWNLFVFFRIPPIVYGLLSIALAWVLIAHLFGPNPFWLWSLGSVFALNPLFLHYTVESRPYALWILLSLLHLVLFVKKAPPLAFGFGALLLALTSTVGMFQIILLEIFARRGRLATLSVLPAIAVALYYAKQDYLPLTHPTFQDWALSLKANLKGVLLIESAWLAYLLAPIVYFAVPGYLIYRRKTQATLIFYAWSLMACTFPLYLLAKKNGFYVAPRHYVFLIPTSFYLLLQSVRAIPQHRYLPWATSAFACVAWVAWGQFGTPSRANQFTCRGKMDEVSARIGAKDLNDLARFCSQQ